MVQQAVEHNLSSKEKARYTVRRLEERDIERAIDVWSASFGFMDRERWRAFALEVSDIAMVGCVDDLPVALSTVINFDMHIDGRWLKCGGIAGVACDPPFRRHGLVRMVLSECIRILDEDKVPFAALWPFSHPFYGRMGWAVTDTQHWITQDLSAIKTDGDSSRYRSIKLTDIDLVMPVHERWISQSNLSLRRSRERWHRQLTRPERSYFLYLHDDGYMLWNIKDPKDRTLEVVEWAYLTERAFMDGLALLKNAGQLFFDKATWIAADLEPLIKMGATFPLPRIETRMGMMTRIVNLDAVVSGLGLKERPEINDPLKISGASESTNAFGPGELVQVLTGFFSQSPEGKPRLFHGAASSRRTFSIEQY